jgi:hypothetical protein
MGGHSYQITRNFNTQRSFLLYYFRKEIRLQGIDEQAMSDLETLWNICLMKKSIDKIIISYF